MPSRHAIFLACALVSFPTRCLAGRLSQEGSERVLVSAEGTFKVDARAEARTEAHAERAERLLAGAAVFLADVPQAELRSLQTGLPLVAELERHGVSVQDAFKWHVLAEHQRGTFQLHPDVSLAEQQVVRHAEMRRKSVQPTERKNISLEATDADLVVAGISGRGVNVTFIQNAMRRFRDFRTWSEHTENEQAETSVSKVSREAYRNWRRLQSIREARFFRGDALPAADVSEAQELLEDNLELNVRLEDFLEMLNSDPRLDANSTDRSASAVSGALRAVRTYLSTTASNTVSLFSQTWGTFKDRLQGRQDDCTREQNGREAEEAASLGLPRGLDMIEHGNLTDESILDEVEKADKLLAKVEAEEEPENVIRAEVAELRRAGRQLEASARDGTLDGDAVSASEESMETVSRKLCAGVHGQQARKLQSVLQAVRSALVSATTIALPGYGMRGAWAGAGPFSGGLEEVIDFRNREIGYFRFGSVSAGSSMFSGVGAGGYVGIGWKGYKENWTLQDAYQTAIARAVGPSISLPIPLNPGIGISFATDADNSGPVWLAEPHGVNGYTFGVGISASLADLVPGAGGIVSQVEGLVGGLGKGASLSKYWMYTSECFDDLRSLLLGMYRPYCATCTGSESKRMAALRVLTHSGSFPVVTEVLHTLLAWSYERVKPEGPTECSDMSTRHRNSARHLVASISRQLGQALRTLERVTERVEEVVQEVRGAIESRPQLVQSERWAQLLQDDRFCGKFPEHSLGDVVEEADVSTESEDWEAIRDDLRSKTRVELIDLCRRHKASLKGCSWRTKESLVRKVALRIVDVADAEDNPFGRCKPLVDDCPLPGQRCARTGGTHRCICDASHCHGLSSAGDDVCEPFADGAAAVERVVTGMRAWLATRKIEIGAYVQHVQDFVDAANRTSQPSNAAPEGREAEESSGVLRSLAASLR